ncbi:MAG: ABC transporter substrate-binding protein [Candidatus Vogelbacteria bacterium]|nr:ABC transporter substrate-binding protein [Candidatus Vogelbacteria bacterium]
MNKKIVISIAVIIIIAFVSVVWWQNKPASAPKYAGPLEKVTIALPLVGVELNTLTLIAKDLGYFKDQGLDVSIKDVPNSVVGPQEVFEGKVDLAGAGDYNFILNSFQQKNVKIVAEIDENTFLTIAARKDSGIVKPSDIKGKKIAIVPKTVLAFFVHQFLFHNGISEKDVQFIPVNSGPELISAVVDKRAEIFAASYSQLYGLNKVFKGGATLLYDNKDRPSSFLLIATDQTLTKRPDVIKRFLQALVLAENFVRDNKYRTQAILKKEFPDRGQDYFDLVWPKHNFQVGLNQSLLINMEDLTRWIIQNKLTNETKIPNYLDYIYFDALEKVKPEAITIIR